MNLTLVRQLPELTLYYDSWNNWLFLDWQGALTLPGVQQASLALLDCCAYPCQRVLNSNANVTHVPGPVTAWLGLELLPLLRQVGVEQLAWVRAATASGQRLVEQALPWLPGVRVLAFDEMEPAVAWLQGGRPPGAVPTPDTPPAAQQLLGQLRRRLGAQLTGEPPAS